MKIVTKQFLFGLSGLCLGQPNHVLGTVAIIFITIITVVFGTSASQAQTVYTYSTSSTSNAYLNASHWTVGSPAVTSTKFPGVDNNPSSTADGATTDIAAIGATAFTASNNFGINFNTGTNTGVGTNTGAAGALSVGAFDFLASASKSFSIGNSSTTAGVTGVLTLNGDTLGGNAVANTIVSNEGSQNYSFVPSVATGTVTPAMSISLGNATANVIQVNGSGGLTFSAAINNGTGNSISIQSTGTGSVTFSGANGYTGGTTVGAGTLALSGSTNNIASSSKIVVNSGGTLNVTGVSGFTLASSQVLTGTGGTVSGNVTVGSGTITAGSGATSGDSIGTLNTAGETWSSAGTFVAKVSGNSGISGALPSSDELSMSGLSSVTSGFKVQLLSTGSTALTPSQQLVLAIVPGSTASSVFTSSIISLLQSNFTSSGVTFTDGGSVQLGEAFASGSGGGDELIAMDSTPEPTSLLLFGAVVSPILLSRRRRRNRPSDVDSEAILCG